MQNTKWVGIWVTLLAALCRGEPMHVIQVVDESTGRGVPTVELTTVNNIQLWTDSNGIVVFDEPGLLGRKVFFTITSDGYEFPKDGFGYRGMAIDTTPREKTIIKIKRINIAERLYRITGAGIYDQTVRAGNLAGASIPIEQPLLNGDVMGQDTVQTIIFDNKLFWFWGDTGKAEYPLGNFGTSGATSELPGHGGLDPSVGVNLHYRVGADGFCRRMVYGVREGGPVWIDGLMILKDPQGQDRLLCSFCVVKSLVEQLQRGLAIWNEKTQRFERLCTFDTNTQLHPAGQPIRVHEDEGDWFYFPSPYGVRRVKANWNAVQDSTQYESFTCLKVGTHANVSEDNLDRDQKGKLIWAWKKNTWPAPEMDCEKLVEAKKMAAAEDWYQMKDEHGQRVIMAAGTVCWNAYRQKWIMIAHQMMGKPSVLGEVWYSEAAHPWGPFERAVKVATHEKYTFYNVVQHPQFDQQGGRIVYFEGTYTQTFSAAPEQTPRYDYNQIMYRLDLGDPRMKWAEQN